MKLSKFVFLLVTVLALLGTRPSLAADEGDIYIELQGGMNLRYSAQMLSELNTGYVVSDNIGLGLVLGQYLVGSPRSPFVPATSIAPEVRWFLEPFEVSISVRELFKETSKKTYFLTGAAYLMAVTPSLAIKGEGRAQLVFGDVWALYWTLGGRMLF